MTVQRLVGCTAMVLSLLWATNAAASSVNVLLTNSLQTLVISNSTASTGTVEQLIYSFGAAGDDRATFDVAGDGTASDFVVDPAFPGEPADYFQTVTFDLDVAPGETITIGGLDIDLIVGLDPLLVVGSTGVQQFSDPGLSLTDAFITVVWSNGDRPTEKLENQIWSLEQDLTFEGIVSAVPVPPSVSALGGALALLLFLGWRRQNPAV